MLLTLVWLGVCSASALGRTPVTCASPSSTTPQPTEYFVSLADNANHIAHVSIRFTEASGAVILNMPVWNALYQVRDFAANVEDVRGHDASGQPAPVRQTKTSEWLITPTGPCLVVEYDVHLNASGPFGAQLSTEHGFFNWAMVLMYSPSTRTQQMSLQFLDVPQGWALHDVHIMGEAPAGKVEQVVGVAANYDELVDSPAEVGVFQHFDFQQDGATYHIVVHASPGDYDTAKLKDTLQRITRVEVDWMADRPFGEYTFLYHFPRGHGAGGMEHAYGTAIDLNAEHLKNTMMPVASVSAHEFFHLWNVKRIRPQSLEPIDYQHIMDTRALWFSEGLTSTVGDLMLARAGLLGERQYLDRVAAEITELQVRSAHRWQSVEESSLDAWFEDNAFYRTPERSISYYNKGEVVGVLLDLRIRQLTDGRKSLRDLFRWMNDNYAKKGLFFPDSDGVQRAAETVTGQSFVDFFRSYVAGASELPYNEYFAFVGLQAAETNAHYASPGFSTSANLGGQPEVTKVDDDSEARRAGISVGDRILQLNGKPTSSSFEYEVSQMREGSTVKLRLANRSGERTVKIRLVAHQEQAFVLQDMPQVTPEQRAHRAAWIRGDDENGGLP
ncbi:MAG TPA: PDZ domain-containing protein [Candidatus Angelobacter sp.]|nr:PDZ domain-containing protein [Candidatus Angelobacter sp.]